MIQLIVDSSCDFPQDWGKAHGIPVLPLMVSFDGREYRDGDEVTLKDLLEPMKRGIVPKTSQVPAADMYKLFSCCCKEGKDFIFLCISGPLSGTYATALGVKDVLQKEYPGVNMAVADSRGASLAAGLMAMQTWHNIQKGFPFAEIVKRLEAMITYARHFFTLDSLDWLAKGGRLPKGVGVVGDVFKIKPILDIKDGLISLAGLSRGRKKTFSAIVNRLKEEASAFPKQLVAVAHSNDLPAAQEVARLIHALLPGCKTVIQEIGCALGVHLGIGGVGVFWLNQSPPDYCLLEEG